MNYGRERGTLGPGVFNGEYNPAIVQTDQAGEIRFFLKNFSVDSKRLVQLTENPLVFNGSIKPQTKAAYSDRFLNAVIWRNQTSNFGLNNIFSVAYGNGVWVAGGSIATLCTSKDDTRYFSVDLDLVAGYLST